MSKAVHRERKTCIRKKIDTFGFQMQKALTFWSVPVIKNTVKKGQREYTYEKGLSPWLYIRGVNTKAPSQRLGAFVYFDRY